MPSDGVSSFLFQGQAPVPQPTGSDTTSSFPLWMQSGIYNLSGAAFNLANQPYTPYTGQLTATPSGQTQEAWQLAGQNVNDWQPAINQAGALTAAAGTPINAADINQYENPYNQDVVQGLEGASNYNLFNNVLPQVQSEFVSAGQGASPQQMQATNNAVYNSETALNPALSQALQTGYSGALTTAMGEQQAQQTAGAQMGQLGALTSQLGSYDVANLESAGTAQDTLAQENLNSQYAQYENQLQWPYQQLQYASGILRGAQGLIPTTSQGVGETYPPAYGASPVTTALGTAALAGSVGIKRGGHISRRRIEGYADGGAVGNDNYAGDPSSLVYAVGRGLEYAGHPAGWGGGTEKGSSLPPLSERMQHWDEVDAERKANQGQKTASTGVPGYASGGTTILPSDVAQQVVAQEEAMGEDPLASTQNAGAVTYTTPNAPVLSNTIAEAPIEQFTTAGSSGPSTGAGTGGGLLTGPGVSTTPTISATPGSGVPDSLATAAGNDYGQLVQSVPGSNPAGITQNQLNALLGTDTNPGPLLEGANWSQQEIDSLTPAQIQGISEMATDPQYALETAGVLQTAAHGGPIRRKRRFGALKHFAVGGPMPMRPAAAPPPAGGGVMAPMASPMIGALGMRRAA